LKIPDNAHLLGDATDKTKRPISDPSSDLSPQTQEGSASWAKDARFLSEIIETQSDLAAVELDLRTIMQMVAQRTQKLTNADGASVQIVEGNYLICRAVSGMMTSYRGGRFGLASSFTGHVAVSGHHDYCEDVEEDERVDRTVTDRLGIRSLICVPICHGAKVVGVLNVTSRLRCAFVHRDALALRLMAGLVAAAISHAAEFEDKKKLLAERTAALAALRDSEERFRSAFDHAAIGMALVAPDGRWLQVNRSICQIVGYTEHELLVRDFQSITHPDDLDADLAQVRRLLAEEIQDYQMVKRYIHRQGHLVWVLLSVSLVRDGDGKPVHFISQIQDVTRRKETEDALRASEDEYRTTFEMAGVGKAQLDLRNFRFVRVNNKLCETLGYPLEELTTLTFLQITHPDDVAQCQEAAIRMARGEQMEFSVDKRFIRKNGSVVWMTLNATVIADASGQPVRAVSTFQDVTERRLVEQLERDRRKVLEMVAKDLPLPAVLGQLGATVEAQIGGVTAGVMVLQDGNVRLHGTHLAPKWRKALLARGLSLAAGLASSAWQSDETCGVTFVADDDVWTELRPLAAKHNIKACWTTPIQSTDTTPLGLLMMFAHTSRRPTRAEAQTLDMAAKLASICIEHHDTTRKLSHLVRHDPLTGLANRVMFEDRLQHAMDLAGRSGHQVGLLVLDIDKFKSINDTHGHQVGDQLLQQFAQRLQAKLRETDTMARMGGDEFVVVLPELRNRDGAAAVAEKLVKSLDQPFAIGSVTMPVTASIGIAIFPGDGVNAVRLQKQADDALYRVKQRGRNGYGF
jgi:diguanylate cyclase (GGDEF)-like protein/PAS domain S-box-containing protein